MRVVFRKQCECDGENALYPYPRMKPHAASIENPEISVELSFSCKVCGKEWLGVECQETLKPHIISLKDKH